MDQLSQLTEELQHSILLLNPARDHKLIQYLCGEVQHLINRIEFGHALTTEEEDEYNDRTQVVSLFKQFYTFVMLNKLLT